MSTTENSEFAVPEVVADEKEESKEIKATKRPAEVSRRIQKKSQKFICFCFRFYFYFAVAHLNDSICGICETHEQCVNFV